jgi:hypothetical protein
MTKKQKRVYDQEYRSKNKYKIKADKAAEYREDPSKAKRRAKYRRERLPSVVLQEKLKWQKEHPENRKRIVRKDSLKRRGWTPELYDTVSLEQENKCWVCGKNANTELHKKLCADHKHTIPPKPRGLLCVLCNLGLGAFRDSPAFLEKAVEYLRKHGE